MCNRSVRYTTNLNPPLIPPTKLTITFAADVKYAFLFSQTVLLYKWNLYSKCNLEYYTAGVKHCQIIGWRVSPLTPGFSTFSDKEDSRLFKTFFHAKSYATFSELKNKE